MGSSRMSATMEANAALAGSPAGKDAEPGDAELLRATTERRDADAFQALYERHGDAAFNLSQYIVRDRARAEDAVQDAMLSVWNQAGQYDPTRGTVRTWMLRIVANAALKVTRSERKHTRNLKMAQERTNVEPAGTAEPSRTVETAEHADVLTGLLARLPDTERLAVALYYGGGMTQEEIADETGVTQTAVSQRIRNALERLRGGLQSAGVAATLPLIGPEALAQALCRGLGSPPTLSERVRHSAQHAARQSARLAAQGLWHAVLSWAATVLLLAGAAAWMLHEGESGGVPEAPVQPAEAAPRDADRMAPDAGSQAAHFIWKGNGGRPGPELETVNGAWSWDEAQHCIVAAEGSALRLPPLSIPPGEIVVVRCVARILSVRRRLHLGAGWGDQHASFHVMVKQFELPANTQPFELQVYLTDRLHIAYQGSALAYVAKISKPQPWPQRVYINFGGAAVSEIEVRVVREDERNAVEQRIVDAIRKTGEPPDAPPGAK